MKYKTVFDISKQGYQNWCFSVLSLIFGSLLLLIFAGYGFSQYQYIYQKSHLNFGATNLLGLGKWQIFFCGLSLFSIILGLIRAVLAKIGWLPTLELIFTGYGFWQYISKDLHFDFRMVGQFLLEKSQILFRIFLTFFWTLYLSFCVFFAIIIFINLIGTFVDFYLLNRSYRIGKYEVVEGLANNFTYKKYRYLFPFYESFEVEGQKFGYTNPVISASFNRASALGESLKAGIYVKVFHLDGKILRLEIAD